MNGTYYNHTMSPHQTQELLRNLERHVRNCISNIEYCTNELLGNLSSIWADDNAIEFEKELRKELDNVITNKLIPSYYKIAQYICNIANGYAAVGGIRQNFTFERNLYTNIINERILYSKFYGDYFGFIGGEQSKKAIEMTSAFDSSIRKNADLFLTNMKHTNAFGNNDIKLVLVDLGNFLSNEITRTMNNISKKAAARIYVTKQYYEKASTQRFM